MADSLKIYEMVTTCPQKAIDYYMEKDGFLPPDWDVDGYRALQRVADYITHLKINYNPPVKTIREADPGDEI